MESKKRYSFRKQVNLKCIDCIYDKHEIGTWRQQVEACTSVNCALYPIRPMSMPKKK